MVNAAAPPSRKHLFDYITIVLKWRRFIFVNLLIVAVLAVIISLLLPKTYKATVSILPPRQQDIFGSLGSAASSIRSLAGAARLGGLGQRQAGYNYLAILNSRSCMEKVVQKFDLVAVYEIPDSSMEKAVKELTDNVSFEEQKDDYFTVEVLDRDPGRCADMANYFVDVLNSISVELGTREARNNRQFVEQRLEDGKKELRASEEALRKYQEKSGMMITPEASSSISGIATLYAMKARKEIELAIAKRSASEENPAVQQMEIELSELNRKLSTIPETGLESFRLYRDVAIQQRIVEFLVPLYEQARIDEQKDIPTVLVLDKAVRPEKRDRPKRMIIVLATTAAALFVLLMIVFIRERIAAMTAEDNQLAAQWNDIRATLTRMFRLRRSS